jgi:hypothetical protein
MKPLQRSVTGEFKEVKRVLASGVSIREAARLCKVSYYLAWHVRKGSYDGVAICLKHLKKRKMKNI